MDSTSIDPAKQQELINNLLNQVQQIQSENSTIEIGPDSGTAPAEGGKSSSTTKILINAVFVIVFLVGIVGSFLTKSTVIPFDMDAYIKFISAFAFIWFPLVIAYGTGRAFKNYTEKRFAAPAAPAATTSPPATGARAVRRK